MGPRRAVRGAIAAQGSTCADMTDCTRQMVGWCDGHARAFTLAPIANAVVSQLSYIADWLLMAGRAWEMSGRARRRMAVGVSPRPSRIHAVAANRCRRRAQRRRHPSLRRVLSLVVAVTWPCCNAAPGRVKRRPLSATSTRGSVSRHQLALARFMCAAPSLDP
jgi:hypothetical protein